MEHVETLDTPMADLMHAPSLGDRDEPIFDAFALAQLPLDLCLFILNSRPSCHYEHLKHILEFESSQLSSPYALQLDDNLHTLPSKFQTPFLPFSLPDCISTTLNPIHMACFYQVTGFIIR